MSLGSRDAQDRARGRRRGRLSAALVERGEIRARLPRSLYRRVRLARAWLPPIIALVVVAYQLYFAQLGDQIFEFWAVLIFYGFIGPLVTFFVLGWIGVEVRERERAEGELRDLYLELSESHRRLAAIQRVTSRVSEAAELELVLEAAISSLVEAVGAQAGVIALEGGLARSSGVAGVEPPLDVPDLTPDLAMLREHRHPLVGLSSWAGARVCASMPLRWGDRVLGAVHIYFLHSASRDALELLEIIVAELAAAIEAAEHRTRDLLTLFEVDRSIRAESNLERLLAGMLERIRARVELELAAVYLADEHGDLSLARSQPALSRVRRDEDSPYLLGALARQVAQTREDLFVADAQRDEGAEVLEPLLEDARSLVGLPMLADGELVGVIVLADRRSHAVSERELPLLRLLANQVTLAVRNARAYLYSEELAIQGERSRIAREIHDGIAQSLAFTALKLDLAGRLMDQPLEHAVRVRTELETAKETLRKQIKEVRRSIFALRPIDLERFGFLETVREFVRDFGEQNDIRAVLDVQGEPKLSPSGELVMFRLLQETLNNVAKHANATSVRVTFDSTGSGTRLSVGDDGVGFDPESLTGRVTSAGGLGLQQMRERVNARGGTFSYSSAPGQGTCVTAWLP